MIPDWDEIRSEREQWAEDHGYMRGRCAIHGTFWSDSGMHCPSCEPEPIESEESDD